MEKADVITILKEAWKNRILQPKDLLSGIVISNPDYIIKTIFYILRETIQTEKKHFSVAPTLDVHPQHVDFGGDTYYMFASYMGGMRSNTDYDYIYYIKIEWIYNSFNQKILKMINENKIDLDEIWKWCDILVDSIEVL